MGGKTEPPLISRAPIKAISITGGLFLMGGGVHTHRRKAKSCVRRGGERRQRQQGGRGGPGGQVGGGGRQDGGSWGEKRGGTKN